MSSCLSIFLGIDREKDQFIFHFILSQRNKSKSTTHSGSQNKKQDEHKQIERKEKTTRNHHIKAPYPYQYDQT